MPDNNNLKETKENGRLRLMSVREQLQPIIGELAFMHVPVFTSLLDQASGMVMSNCYHDWGKADGFDHVISSWFSAEVQQGYFSADTANAIIDLTQNDIFSYLQQKGYGLNPPLAIDMSKVPVVNSKFPMEISDWYRSRFTEVLSDARKQGISGIAVFGTKDNPNGIVATRNEKELGNMYIAALDDVLNGKNCSRECLWMYVISMTEKWEKLRKNPENQK